MTMATIASALTRAQQQLLGADTDSARLDAEILLSAVLDCDRSYLYTWPEKELTDAQGDLFAAKLQRRMNGEPIAYITGKKAFYSLLLAVNPSTLIPRPATETLVEIALQLLPATACRLLDLGTGTGAVALALARARPSWDILAVDCEPQAVQLAQHNAQSCGLSHVELRQSNWFAAVPETDFDVIVSNPPYIDSDDPHLKQGDVRFEPRRALIAADHGLANIKHISHQARLHLKSGGYLMMEHGYQQGAAVRAILQADEYVAVQTVCDLEGRERVTLGHRK